jgi:hypothetical protein
LPAEVSGPGKKEAVVVHRALSARSVRWLEGNTKWPLHDRDRPGFT